MSRPMVNALTSSVKVRASLLNGAFAARQDRAWRRKLCCPTGRHASSSPR